MYSQKIIAKLQQKKYRQEYGCFVVDGKKGVQEALESKAAVQHLIMTEFFASEQREFCAHPAVKHFLDRGEVLFLSEIELARLLDVTTPQGVAAVVKMPQHALSDLMESPLIAVLEDIRDPGNVGTMIRTADWFGVGGLLLVGGADPYQPKVVRSSMGSVFHVPIVSSHDIVSEVAQLKTAGFTVVVTRPEGSETPPFKPGTPGKHCVVFGNESLGTSAQLDNLADLALTIPKFGAAESLNVAVSFGIVMHEMRGM